MSANPFEMQVENPFQQLGLSQVAVEALISPNDPEMLLIAIHGMQRAMARSLHPDALQGKETSESSAFLQGVLEATETLDNSSPLDLMVLAKDYIRKPKRGKAKTEVLSQPQPDTFLPILTELLQSEVGELGLSFDSSKRIFLHSYRSFSAETDYWTMLQRTDTDSYSMTNFHSTPVKGLEEKSEAILPQVPWQRFIIPHDVEKAAKRAAKIKEGDKLPTYTTRSILEVTKEAGIVLYDAKGKPTDTDTTPLQKPILMHEPGFYMLSAEYEVSTDGSLKQTATKFNKNYYEEINSAETSDVRIIGSADKDFMSRVTHIVESYNRGDPPSKRLPLEALRAPQFEAAFPRLYVHELGRKIPENFYSLLSDYFLPSVSSERLLVIAKGAELFIPGEVNVIYNSEK